MTSNHRPTLENKRGKKLVIGDSIAHARTLPQQTSLKYRVDKPYYPVKKQDVDDLKRDIRQKKEETKSTLMLTNTEESKQEDEDEGDKDSDSDSEDNDEELLAELAKIKKSKTTKKSWRSSTFRKPKKQDKSEEFTTESIDSEYHQKFLSKYIR